MKSRSQNTCAAACSWLTKATRRAQKLEPEIQKRADLLIQPADTAWSVVLNARISLPELNTAESSMRICSIFDTILLASKPAFRKLKTLVPSLEGRSIVGFFVRESISDEDLAVAATSIDISIPNPGNDVPLTSAAWAKHNIFAESFDLLAKLMQFEAGLHGVETPPVPEIPDVTAPHFAERASIFPTSLPSNVGVFSCDQGRESSFFLAVCYAIWRYGCDENVIIDLISPITEMGYVDVIHMKLLKANLPGKTITGARLLRIWGIACGFYQERSA
eukprot:TRINITY_DN4833_c0_g2_i1.p1 TRINITY_DN4833_c0_g2~~TRINITY_DN4833_c0_g2_i1.p1  ORF type:complete len:276 (-),score=55.48 TRINITY_DN4833_c0_g2_i1:80-907(-)